MYYESVTRALVDTGTKRSSLFSGLFILRRESQTINIVRYDRYERFDVSRSNCVRPFERDLNILITCTFPTTAIIAIFDKSVARDYTVVRLFGDLFKLLVEIRFRIIISTAYRIDPRDRIAPGSQLRRVTVGGRLTYRACFPVYLFHIIL